MVQYAIIHNNSSSSLVALPSTDVLSDLAYEKGWRVLHQDVGYTELQQWVNRTEILVMDAVQFFLDYLEESDTDTDYEHLKREAIQTENTVCYSEENNFDDEDVAYATFDEFEPECQHEHVKDLYED